MGEAMSETQIFGVDGLLHYYARVWCVACCGSIEAGSVLDICPEGRIGEWPR
jgi:hypothetical protein